MKQIWNLTNLFLITETTCK